MTTKKALITRIYSNQKTNSKRRNHSLPSYSKEEFSDWLFSQKLFHELYNTWKTSGFESDLKPSIDREDPYLPYSFQNIRLTTWIENNTAGNLDRRTGKNNKLGKPVQMCSPIGNHSVLREFHSQKEAERQTGIKSKSISVACYKNTLAGGFKWRFKNA